MVKRESSYHTKNINQVLRVKMDPLSEEILWAAVSRCLFWCGGGVSFFPRASPRPRPLCPLSPCGENKKQRERQDNMEGVWKKTA